MSIDITKVSVRQIRDQITLYLNELDEQYPVPGVPFKLPRDWVRYRCETYGSLNTGGLTKPQTAQLYADLHAAFPLRTVPLDGMLWVQPVPYQQPLPPITPEYAQRVWNQLREVCGPTGLTAVQLMEIMEESIYGWNIAT